MFDTCSVNGFSYAFISCNLTAQSIENILVSLDTSGQSNGVITLSGGTNTGKAAWTPAALTAESTLTSKGWTIASNV